MSARGGFALKAHLGAVLLAAALALPATSALAAEASATKDLRERGEAVYTHRCAMCHTEGQTGTFSLARRIGAEKSVLAKRTDLTGPYIRQVVRYGIVNMPRISRVELPDADLDAVIAYLTPQ